MRRRGSFFRADRRTSGRLGALWGLALAVGVGAALMYTADPQSGRRRRALARDKAIRVARWASEAILRKEQGLLNRTRGLLARLGASSTDDIVPAQLLTERVRAAVGHLCSHPGALEVLVDDGRVTLRGPILAEEADGLLTGLLDVPGVRVIEDDLERHDSGVRVPPLQS